MSVVILGELQRRGKRSKRRGHDRERQVCEQLRNDAWIVVRTAGSFGTFDIMAARGGQLRLIEVKSTTAGPWADFGPQAREDLWQAANQAGGEAWLCWWPPRKQPEWWPSSKWPGWLV